MGFLQTDRLRLGNLLSLLFGCYGPVNASNSAFLLLPRKNCNGKPVRKKYVDDWKPVLSLMFNDTKHLIINTVTEDINAVFLETTYVVARNKLEERYPTLFAGDNPG